MARDRANPPKLGELIQQGVLDKIIQDVLASVPPGTDIYTTDILYDAVVRNTPPLLPSTFNALLRRAGHDIEARWADTPPEDFAEAQIGQIPIQPERTGKQADFTGRILYRIDVTVPTEDGGSTTRTIYVPASAPLALDQLRAEALEALRMVFEQSPERYREFAEDWESRLTFTIEDVSRSY